MSYTPTEWKPNDIATAARWNKLEQGVGELNMSYTPNTWVDGQVPTAAKLNALEQAVASGGGSDFVAVTFNVSGPEYSAAFYLEMFEAEDASYKTGMTINGESGISSESVELLVDNGVDQTENVYILPTHYVIASTYNADEIYTITGNAETDTVIIEGHELYVVKVYGDCTISVVGTR